MEKKAFVSTQLLAVLPPMALKTLMYICNWQNSPNGIMLYEHRFAKTLKMTEQEVRLCIQTLINLKLIDLTRIDGKWRIEINVDEFGKYLKIPMERVIEHEGYKMADKVEYEAVEENKPSSIEDMSDDDLKKLLMRIEASLSERQQVKELVKTNVQSDLPF
jgi:hypothetical protein